jgi:hypothetical protein
MLPQRISAKFFIENEVAVDLAAVIPMFHRWIRHRAVPGLLVDVADYKHVPDGPGILLVGHEGDYAVDVRNGRPGIQYTHKRTWLEATLAERLQVVLDRALQAVQVLQSDSDLGWTIRTNAVELVFPDRLHIPNTPETFAAVKSEIQTALRAQFVSEVSVVHVGEGKKRPFTIHATLATTSILTSERLLRSVQ